MVHKRLLAGSFSPLSVAPFFTLLAFQRVHLCDECRGYSVADVLADDPAVLLANAIVVASFPRHRLCYPFAFTPLGSPSSSAARRVRSSAGNAKSVAASLLRDGSPAPKTAPDCAALNSPGLRKSLASKLVAQSGSTPLRGI